MDLRGRAQQPDPPPATYVAHSHPEAVVWATGVTAKNRMLVRQHAYREGHLRSVCSEHLVERLTIAWPVGLPLCPACERRVRAWGLPVGRAAEGS